MAPAMPPRRRAPRLLLLGATVLAAMTPVCWVSSPSVEGARGLSSRLALRAEKKKNQPVVPVVDDSGFDIDGALEDDLDLKPKGGKKETLDSIVEAADGFGGAGKARRREKSTLSLQEDIKGLSLEDDVDLSIGMMKAARSGKVDVSLEGRLGAWLGETKELISNPTPIQLTYVAIFWGSFVLIILAAGLVVGLGGVRLRGDGADSERRRQLVEQDAFVQRSKLLRENKARMGQVRDKRELSGLPAGQGLGGVDNINYGPPVLLDIPKVKVDEKVFGSAASE